MSNLINFTPKDKSKKEKFKFYSIVTVDFQNEEYTLCDIEKCYRKILDTAQIKNVSPYNYNVVSEFTSKNYFLSLLNADNVDGRVREAQADICINNITANKYGNPCKQAECFKIEAKITEEMNASFDIRNGLCTDDLDNLIEFDRQ